MSDRSDAEMPQIARVGEELIGENGAVELCVGETESDQIGNVCNFLNRIVELAIACVNKMLLRYSSLRAVNRLISRSRRVFPVNQRFEQMLSVLRDFS